MKGLWILVTGVLTGAMLFHVINDPINGATFLGMGALIYSAHKVGRTT